jgi:hypothetical protein
MSDVTCILEAFERGDSHAAEQLLPFLYDELRQLAAQRLAREPRGQTLEPRALVHEAYLRSWADKARKHWDGHNHFFAAAAAAMRRIHPASSLGGAERGKLRARIIGPGTFAGEVRAIAFTPDGRYLCTAYANGMAYVLEVGTPP